MHRVALHLFGTPRVTVDGAPVAIHRRKSLALLSYLAVTQRPHSRETLATLLWPESDHFHARLSLRRHLSQLNGIVGSGLFVADRANVNLPELDELWVDVGQFRAHLAQCRAHGHASEMTCPACLPLLEQAAALYENDFLRGFTLPDTPDFDEWQRYEGESLRAALGSALERLGAAHAANRNLGDAVGYARRWVALDPLHEPAQQLLVQLYVESDQHTAARRQYDEYVDLLDKELGVSIEQNFEEFGAPVSAAHDAGSFAPHHVTSTVTEHDGGKAVVRPPAFLYPHVRPATVARGPFVAREHRIAQLDRFLHKAMAGHGQIAFVSGEAGSGKTVLLQEFARRALDTHRELVCAQGTCDVYTGVGDPYLPFRDILLMLCGDVESLWAAGGITRDHALRLWHLLPETSAALVEHAPDLLGAFLGLAAAVRLAAQCDDRRVSQLLQIVEDRSGHTPDQSRLFEQFTDLVKALSIDRPLVLLVDDLHWADVSSISLLFHLARRIIDSRILIVGAYRTEEISVGRAGRAHPLEQIIYELKARAGELDVNLDQDMTAEGRLFVDALLDTQPNRLDEGFRKELFRHSRGHALFTTELLRDLQDSGDLVQDGQGRWVEGPTLRWEKLPAKVEGVIEKRVSRLSDEVREVLAVASVEGENFTAEVIARALGTNAGEMIRLLSDTLERRHRLVHARGVRYLGSQRMSRYRFRHNLFQLYLHNKLDGVQRAYLHEKVGNALEDIYSEQREDSANIAGQLARHFEQAGQTDKAIEYRYTAGQRAIRISANQEAVKHLQRGLALLETLPRSRENLQRGLEMRIALGVPVTALHGYASPDAEKVYSEALAQCGDSGDTPWHFPAMYGMWRYYVLRSELHTAMELSNRLMRLAENLQDRSLVLEAERALGVTHFHRGELKAARVHLERGVDLYVQEQDRGNAYVYGHDPMVSLLGYLAFTLWQLGYPDQALRAVERLLSFAHELAHPFSLTHAMTVGALQTYQHRGDVEAELDLGREALELAESLGFPFWIGRARFHIGRARFVQGDRREGIAQMRAGIGLWRTVGTEAVLPYFLGLLAQAYLQAGQVEYAVAPLNEALCATHATGERWWEPELYRLRGDLIRAQGADTGDAEAAYRQALDSARELGAKSHELRAATSLSCLWRDQGRRWEARSLLADVYGFFSEGFDTGDLREARRLLASLEAA